MSTTTNTPALIDAAGVAGMLSMSIRTVWRLTAAGTLPQPVRYNRKLVRWKRADLLAALGLPADPTPTPAEVPAKRPPQALGDVLTARQAARLLGCSQHTVCRMIRSGELAAVKRGREYFIRKADAEAVFAEVPVPA